MWCLHAVLNLAIICITILTHRLYVLKLCMGLFSAEQLMQKGHSNDLNQHPIENLKVTVDNQKGREWLDVQLFTLLCMLCVCHRVWWICPGLSVHSHQVSVLWFCWVQCVRSISALQTCCFWCLPGVKTRSQLLDTVTDFCPGTWGRARVCSRCRPVL